MASCWLGTVHSSLRRVLLAVVASAAAGIELSSASGRVAWDILAAADESDGGALQLLQVFAESRYAQSPGAAEEVLAPGAGTFSNPILRGSYPDPSIVRVDDDYYMVSSSFEYFPGIPIHHSRDLVTWELVGHALHRPEQVRGPVNLMDVQQDGGIQAATIRYYEGTFYVITTSVYNGPGSDTGNCTNFVVTAADVRGPWSQPHVLETADGIDSSLFFDDDGRAWYTGAHSPQHPAYIGQGELYLQELDLDSWSLKGERSILWHGACGGTWVEAPHIYKWDDRYYLIAAEGGTGYHHAVMAAVSDDIRGPYVSDPRNPILTSRHLSYDYWVRNAGHADFVELPDGRWYAVVLGVRNEINRSSNMGRESFLVPMVWEREPDEYGGQHYLWPVLAPETGRVERVAPLPFTGSVQLQRSRFHDDFSADALNLEWNFRRLPTDGTYSLAARPGFLRLFAKAEVMSEKSRSRAAMLGVRQEETDFTFRAAMNFAPRSDQVAAGVILWQKDDVYIQYMLTRENGAWKLSVVHQPRGKQSQTLGTAEVKDFDGEIVLEVSGSLEGCEFAYSLAGKQAGPESMRRQVVSVASAPRDALLYQGYTGAYMGIYCTTNGEPLADGDFADFDWVERISGPRGVAGGSGLGP